MSDLLRHRTSGFANSSIGPPHSSPCTPSKQGLLKTDYPDSDETMFALLQGLVGVIKLFLLVVVLLVNLALLVGLCYCFSCSNGVVCVIDGGFVIGDDKYYWWWQCYW